MSKNGHGTSTGSLLVVGTGIQWAAHATAFGTSGRSRRGFGAVCSDRRVDSRAGSGNSTLGQSPSSIHVTGDRGSRSTRRWWGASWPNSRGFRASAPPSTEARRCSLVRRTNRSGELAQRASKRPCCPASRLWTACSPISAWIQAKEVASCSKAGISFDDDGRWIPARTSSSSKSRWP